MATSSEDQPQPNLLAPGTDINSYVFKINDIVLRIPPSQISVHKEDMFWQWKTLRTKQSTKVPSGRGICHVQIQVVFTPDLLLTLHRLVVQFKHSPFCWIENLYLRDAIVPHWPVSQYMAFTLSSINISSMKGNPGSFIAELDLRWFNYFPYTSNFLFKDEWKTYPFLDEKNEPVQYTIPTFGKFNQDTNSLDKKATTVSVDKALASATVVRQPNVAPKRIPGQFTVSDLINSHVGTSFDLQPLPNRMMPSSAVPDPSLSRIYVRYINALQQKALYENFGIDICALLEKYRGMWETFTAGELGGKGLVRGLHTGYLPEDIRSYVISRMLESTQSITFFYDEYVAMNLNVPARIELNDWAEHHLDRPFGAKARKGEPQKISKPKSLPNKQLSEIDLERTLNGGKPTAAGEIGRKWYPPISNAILSKDETIWIAKDKDLFTGGGQADITPIYAVESGIVSFQRRKSGKLEFLRMKLEHSSPDFSPGDSSRAGPHSEYTIHYHGIADSTSEQEGGTYIDVSVASGIENNAKVKKGQHIGWLSVKNLSVDSAEDEPLRLLRVLILDRQAKVQNPLSSDATARLCVDSDKEKFCINEDGWIDSNPTILPVPSFFRLSDLLRESNINKKYRSAEALFKLKERGREGKSLLENLQRLTLQLEVIQEEAIRQYGNTAQMGLVSVVRFVSKDVQSGTTVYGGSQHPVGRACDFWINGLNIVDTARLVTRLIKENKIYQGGIGVYGKGHANANGEKIEGAHSPGVRGFLHYDIRCSSSGHTKCNASANTYIRWCSPGADDRDRWLPGEKNGEADKAKCRDWWRNTFEDLSAGIAHSSYTGASVDQDSAGTGADEENDPEVSDFETKGESGGELSNKPKSGVKNSCTSPGLKIKHSKERWLRRLKRLEERQIRDQVVALEAAGWEYYKQDLGISNVYSRTAFAKLAVTNWNIDGYLNEVNSEELKYSFARAEGAVCTGMSGGLRHMVASVPILGHEFPTHQHLGSMEPLYSLQLTGIDNITGESLGKPIQKLESMRATLMRNARSFRPVIDSWSLATDCFMTRFLGTYTVRDLIDGDTPLKKRTCITNMLTETVPGHPGVSSVNIELSATNPFLTEYIEPEETTDILSLYDRRKKVLNALYTSKYTKHALEDTSSKLKKWRILKALADMYGNIVTSVEQYEELAWGTELAEFSGSIKNLSFADTSDVSDPLKKLLNDGKTLLVFRSDYIDTKDDTGLIAPSYDDAVMEGYPGIQKLGKDPDLNEAFVTQALSAESTSKVPLLKLEKLKKFIAPLNLTQHEETMLEALSASNTNSLFRLPTPSNYRDAYLWEAEMDRLEESNSGGNSGLLVLDVTEIMKDLGFEANTDIAGLSGELRNNSINSEVVYYAVLQEILRFARLSLVEFEFGGKSTEELSVDFFGSDGDGLPADSFQPAFYSSLMYAWEKFYSFYLSEEAYTLHSGQAVLSEYDYTKNQIHEWFDYLRKKWPALAANKNKARGDNAFIEDQVKHHSVSLGWSGDYWQHQLINSFFSQVLGVGIDSDDPDRVSYNEEGWQEIAFMETDNFINDFYFDEVLSFGIRWPDYYRDTVPFIAKFTANEQFNGIYLQAITASWWLTCPWTEFGLGTRKETNQAENRKALERRWPSLKGTRGKNGQLILPEQCLGIYIMDNEVGNIPAKPSRTTAPFYALEANENSKVKWVKSMLTRLADRLLKDPEFKDRHGLHDVNVQEYLDTEKQGTSCYKDMDLPDHPFYATDISATSPDFYFWNLHSSSSPNQKRIFREEVKKQMKPFLHSAYNHLKSMEGEGLATFREVLKSQKGGEGTEGAISIISEEFGQKVNLSRLSSQWEASDTQTVLDSKPKAYGGGREGELLAEVMYHPSPYVKRGESYVPNPDISRLGLLPTPAWHQGGEHGAVLSGPLRSPFLNIGQTLPAFASPKAVDIARRQNKESANKSRADLQKNLNIEKGGTYPVFGGSGASSVVDAQNWDFIDGLKANARDIEHFESMFGSAEGYALGKNFSDSDNHESDFKKEHEVHYFSKPSLERIAEQSSHDITSEKMSMKRAFPTFKLFFVEEDENESRWLDYDDFYSFNGVQEFSIHRTRKSPGDTATIVMQNIAGTLDGTRKGVPADADAFKDDKTETEVESKTIRKGKKLPFGSVVLRPGINAQLRVGYSNDASQLEVMISGRVTDVAWSKQGDRVEVILQSFGAELDQLVPNNQSAIAYPTTHHLLGSLMLSPQLKHFGRWEWGQRFQRGEAKDAGIDFYAYGEDAKGSLDMMTAFQRWVINHKEAVAIAGIAGSAALWFGPGRILKAGSKTPLTVASDFAKDPTSIGWKRGLWQFTKNQGKKMPGFFKGTALGVVRHPITYLAGGHRAVLSKRLWRGITPDKLANELVDQGVILQKATGPLNRAQWLKLLEKRLGGTQGLRGKFGEALKREWMEMVDNTSYSSFGTAQIRAKALLELIQANDVRRSHGYIGALVQGVSGKITRGTDDLISIMPDTGWGVAKEVGLAGVSQPAAILGRAAFSAAALGAVADALERVFIEGIWDWVVGDMKKQYKKGKAFFKLHPADDNLFPPAPPTYMRPRRKGGETKLKELFYNQFQAIVWLPFSDLETFADKQLNDFLQSKKAILFDKRLLQEDASYSIGNSTTWDIFHEMSLRHPGWIYGVRPYGNKFEYRMFFGIPSQRYWSLPYEGALISRLNDIRALLDADTVSDEAYERLYGKADLDYLDRIAPNEGASEKKRNFLKKGRLQKEYLTGLENRFVPFRRYHIIDSNTDIVANNITSSEHNIVNSVDVQIFDPINSAPSAPIRTINVKAHKNIEPSKLKTGVPISYPNCRSYQAGIRYGMGQLLHTMREMYRGEVLILGNPRIRPWDIAFLQDSYHDMAGPVEVEAVTHMFSHETGFLTEIKPNAVVIGNEISSWPILEALKIFLLAYRDNIDGKGSLDLYSDDDLKTIVGDNPRAEKILNKILERAGLPDADELEPFFDENEENRKLWEKTVKEKYLRLFGENGFDLSLVFPLPEPSGGGFDITSSDGLTSDSARENAYGAFWGLALGGTAFGVTRKFRPSWTSKAAPLAGLAGFFMGRDGDMIPSNKTEGNSIAWYVGGSSLFSKMTEEETVIVVPLKKGGKPIVSGLDVADPLMEWRNAMGNITNVFADTLEGSNDLYDEYMSFGDHIWRFANNWNAISANKIDEGIRR